MKRKSSIKISPKKVQKLGKKSSLSEHIQEETLELETTLIDERNLKKEQNSRWISINNSNQNQFKLEYRYFLCRK